MPINCTWHGGTSLEIVLRTDDAVGHLFESQAVSFMDSFLAFLLHLLPQQPFRFLHLTFSTSPYNLVVPPGHRLSFSVIDDGKDIETSLVGLSFELTVVASWIECSISCLASVLFVVDTHEIITAAIRVGVVDVQRAVLLVDTELQVTALHAVPVSYGIGTVIIRLQFQFESPVLFLGGISFYGS